MFYTLYILQYPQEENNKLTNNNKISTVIFLAYTLYYLQFGFPKYLCCVDFH